MKKKKFKQGKIKRHKMRLAAGIKNGFGKPWSAPSIMFRVEFCWVENNEESNEQTHWIECRRFQGKERQHLALHYAQSEKECAENETLESRYISCHVADYLVKQRQMADGRWQKFFQEKGFIRIPDIDKFNWDVDPNNSYLLIASKSDRTPDWANNFPSASCPLPSAFLINQAFVFPSSKKDNETIRQPIYQVKWTKSLAANCNFEDKIMIVLRNSIYHHPLQKS